jgi:uncharacterized protein (DUF2062 family)
VKRTGGFRRYLRELLLVDEPPGRTALVYALGVFIGFSPFLGFHTLIALAILVLFRVNRLAILAGIYTNTPWTIAPAATFGTGIGLWLLGSDASFPILSREKLMTGEFREALFSDFRNLVLPFLVGNLVLAAVLGVVAFFVARHLLVRYGRSRETTKLSATASEPLR